MVHVDICRILYDLRDGEKNVMGIKFFYYVVNMFVVVPIVCDGCGDDGGGVYFDVCYVFL